MFGLRSVTDPSPSPSPCGSDRPPLGWSSNNSSSSTPTSATTAPPVAEKPRWHLGRRTAGHFIPLDITGMTWKPNSVWASGVPYGDRACFWGYNYLLHFFQCYVKSTNELEHRIAEDVASVFSLIIGLFIACWCKNAFLRWWTYVPRLILHLMHLSLWTGLLHQKCWTKSV